MALLYVSTTGSDTNSGAFTSPVKSLTKAAQLAQPGDTVMVHGGVYSGLVRIENNGTASAPITFKAVEGEKPVIDGLGTPANTHLVAIGGDYVTFQGFEVRNSTDAGIMTWNAHDVKILNNNVHDSFNHGIYSLGGDNVSSYNNLIAGNEVWNNVEANANRATSQPWNQALSVHKSDNSIIKNNYVHDNYGEGIDAIATKGSKIIGNIVHDNYSVNIYLDNAQDAVVQGNTVYHTYNEAFYAWGGPAHGIGIANEFTDRMLPSSGITVTNNVLVGVGNVTYASHYGANTGLINSTIASNTVNAMPAVTLNNESDIWSGNNYADLIKAGFGADGVFGYAGNDKLYGESGNDDLYGGNNNDLLVGGSGWDYLCGGLGRDTLVGGLNSDVFDFNAIAETSGADRDRIVGFTDLTDEIDLSAIDAIAGGVDDAFDFRGVGAFTDEGQVRLRQVGDHTIVEINTARAGNAEATILLTHILASSLTAADFVL